MAERGVTACASACEGGVSGSVGRFRLLSLCRHLLLPDFDSVPRIAGNAVRIHVFRQVAHGDHRAAFGFQKPHVDPLVRLERETFRDEKGRSETVLFQNRPRDRKVRLDGIVERQDDDRCYSCSTFPIFRTFHTFDTLGYSVGRNHQRKKSR